MKASELIRKLQEQIELHGDCELWVESYDYDFDRNNSYPINDVTSGRRYIRPRELENVFYIK